MAKVAAAAVIASHLGGGAEKSTTNLDAGEKMNFHTGLLKREEKRLKHLKKCEVEHEKRCCIDLYSLLAYQEACAAPKEVDEYYSIHPKISAPF
uniref:Uncharacterized protein n=1 Tax=Oryza brachyantha TaxID=4533 RepID=J3M5U6_ORYBR